MTGDIVSQISSAGKNFVMYKILYIHRYSTIHINCQVSDSVFVISSINPICFLCIYYKNNVQIIFVRWRGDSEIVEANAEHGFRLKKLIGMLCATLRPDERKIPEGIGTYRTGERDGNDKKRYV